MRYSSAERFRVREPKKKDPSAEEFFDGIARATSAEDRRGGVLLVGGISPRDLVVRQTQAELRMDRLPSYWSHAALILDWPERAHVDDVIGAEVTLDPLQPDQQVPERNGVTLFRLSRYADRRRYPNLAFATICDAEKRELKDEIEWAALNPNRDRLRYRLWEWLGLWTSHTFAPAAAENPIANGIPLPGAAFCEYVYEAAGLDLTPGATAPNACPEHLWNTLLYWHNRLGPQVERIEAWRVVRPEEAPTRKPLPISLEADFRQAKKGPRAQPRKRSRGRRRSQHA